MEPLQILHKPRSQPLLLALQRYYYHHRKSHLPVPAKLVYFLHALQCLQMLALLFPYQADWDLPWNYSRLGVVWAGLGLVTSPWRLLERLGVGVQFQVTGLAVLIGTKLAFFLLTASAFAAMPNFEAWMATAEKRNLERLILRLDFCLGLLLFRMLYLPANAYLLEHVNDGGSVVLPCLEQLAIFTVMKLMNTTYVGSTSWFGGDLETHSSPQAQVQMWGLDWMYVALMANPNFKDDKMHFAGILTLLGAVKMGKVVLSAPYHKQIRNLLELVKALIMLWGGSVLSIAVFNHSGQDSILATCLFFLLFPFLFLLFAHLMLLRSHSMARILLPRSLLEVEQILRVNIEDGSLSSKQVSVAFTTAGQLFPKSTQLVLWTLYYYRHLKDVICVQVHVSKLMKMKWGVFGYIECYYCLKEAQGWLKTLPEQAEPCAFWEYQENLRDLQNIDQEITRIHTDLFTELSQIVPTLNRTMRLMRKLAWKSKKYDEYVQTTIKQHPICPELLSLYSSFLSSLSNSRQALKYRALERRVADSLRANKSENSVDLYDSNCMIVVMSLEPDSTGMVIWARNTNLLGFEASELIGSDHSLVIPQPLKDSHTDMLKRITEFRHHHPVYESRHHLYFAHHSGLLLGAHWKVRLVNMPLTGRMCVVAALKRRPDAATVAFVGKDQRTVTAMVRNRQTEGFAARIRELTGQEALTSFVLSEVFGEDLAEWKEGEVYLQRPEKDQESTARWLIKGEVLKIFDLYPQPILKIYRETTGAFHSVRPLVEGSGCLYPDEEISASVEAISTVGRPTLNSQQLLLHLKARRSESKRKTQLFASIIESGITAVGETEKVDTQRDAWKQVNDIKRGQRTKVVALIRTFDLAVAAVLAVTLVALLSVFIVMNSASEYKGNLERLMAACRDREWAVLASIRAREMEGIAGKNGSVLDSIALALQTHITDLQDSFEYREVYKATNGLWLEASPLGFAPYSMNTLELLKQLASHLNQLAVSLDTAGKDFRSVLRNGAGEVQATANQTVASIMQRDKEGSKDTIVPLISIMAILCDAFLLSLCSVVAYKRVNFQRRKLWVLLQALPRGLYSAAKSYSRERLEELYSATNTQYESEAASPTDSTAQKRTAGFETLPEMKVALAAVGCLLLVAVGAIAGMNLVGNDYRAYFHQNVPSVLNSASLRKVSLLQVHFYYQEKQHPESYFSLCPAYQPFYSLTKELYRSLSTVYFYEKNLLFPGGELALDTASLNADLTEFLYQQVQSQRLLGFHLLLLSAIEDVLNSLGDVGVQVNTAAFADLYAASDYISEKYKEKAVEELGKRQQLAWGVTLAVAAVLVAGYFLAVRRLLIHMVRVTVEEWRILTFLPTEAATVVLRILKQ